MQCRFNFTFSEDYNDRKYIYFAFEPQCYSKNAKGFWSYDPHLATDENLLNFLNDGMPDYFVQAAKQNYGFDKEEVLLV
jgi:GH43 family beta-xylosidase